MLTHLDPQDPKNGNATKLHKLQGVCTDDGRVGGRAGSASVLQREERTAVRQCHGQGALAPGRI